jgi:hypothetical protein
MRKYFLIVLGFSLFANAQSNKITFSYDSAGNQIKRELCLSCLTDKSANTPPKKQIIALEEEDLQKFFPEDVISYYPNPVKEELYLKWELTEQKTVSTIYLFSSSGQQLQAYNGLDQMSNYTIPFLNYPQGIYLVNLVYNDGESKTIKIVK